MLGKAGYVDLYYNDLFGLKTTLANIGIGIKIRNTFGLLDGCSQ